MNAFILASTIVGILSYFPLWRQIKSHEIKQNLLTWCLWAILDSIICITIIVQNGNFVLPLICTIGSLITAVLISKSRSILFWTRFETMILFMVFGSMIIWHLSGSKIATIASTLSMIIASIPQLVDAYKKPQDMPLFVYVLGLIANYLSVLGAKNWSIEEVFFPISTTLLCLLFMLFTARRFFNISKIR